jgi:hypothetical protein
VAHRRKGIAGKAIVCFQLALSTLLVVGAALFVRTLLNLDSVNPGFRTDHLLLLTIELPRAQYPPPTDVALFRNIEEKLGGIPGVESATLSAVALIAKSISMDDFIRLDTPRGQDSSHGAWDNPVGRNFFSTMGIPIVAGRNFASTDTETAPKVAVSNQALARQYFPPYKLAAWSSSHSTCRKACRGPPASRHKGSTGRGRIVQVRSQVDRQDLDRYPDYPHIRSDGLQVRPRQ